MPPTYITGMGIITSIGNNVEENLTSIRQEKSGIHRLELLDTVHKDSFVAGEIDLTNDSLSQLAGLAPNHYPRTTILGMVASKEALEHAGIADVNEVPTGLVVGSTLGGMDKTERYYRNLVEHNDFIRTHNCGYSTEAIADFLDIRGFITTLSTACSSAANAILYGSMLIENGVLDRVVVGGMDALTKFTLNGFNSLLILDQDPCKPFDNNRKGLNLGEGAGFMVLESEKALSKAQKEPICKLKGYANSNDAYHQTASSPEGYGLYLSITEALKQGGLSPGQIDYINIHGTGTPNNDLTEGIALKKVFGDELPKFSSTKSMVGHTLGAAGGIEAVYSILALKEGIIPPNLNFHQPIEELDLWPVTNLMEHVSLDHVLTNSFGFGGNDTTLIFSKK